MTDASTPPGGAGVQPGTSFVSPGRTVTETDVVNFSGLSGDYSELHTNEQFVQGTAFGRRIAHGLLVMAIQSGLIHRALPEPLPVLAFLGIKEWNFRKPVFIGDTIRVRVTLQDVRASKTAGRNVTTWKREVLNQHDDIVQDGLTTLLLKA